MTDTYTNLDRLTHFTLSRFRWLNPIAPNLEALSEHKREMLELCEAAANLMMAAATSNDSRIAHTKFGSMPHTAYSLSDAHLIRMLTLFCDGNARRAKLMRDVYMDCGESIYYVYELCAARRFRADILRRY